MNDYSERIERPEERAAYDQRTLLIGLWRRRAVFPLILLVAVALGMLAGATLGAPSYEAETNLMFRSLPSDNGKSQDTVVAATLANAIATKEYVEKTRAKLGLKMSAEALAKRFDVTSEKGTTMISLVAKSENPRLAVDLANTLAATFKEDHDAKQRLEQEQVAKDQERRMAQYEKQLQEREMDLQKFMIAHPGIDLTPTKTESSSALDSQKRQVEVDLAVNEAQGQKLDAMVEEARHRTSNSPAVADISKKASELKEKINQDKSYRANMADLAMRETEYTRAERMRAKGLMSEAEFQRIKAAYEKQKAVTVDTGEVQQWKKELAVLSSMPSAPASTQGSSQSELQMLLVRSLTNQMDHIALEEKQRYLNENRGPHGNQKDLPTVQARFDALKRRIDLVVTNMKDLSSQLSQSQVKGESLSSDLTVMSPARTDTVTSKDRRVLVDAIVTIFGLALGAALLLRAELADTTVKSREDFRLRVPHVQLLGVVRRLPRSSPPFPPSTQSPLADAFSTVARQIRFKRPRPGTRVLLAGVSPGEGTTTAAANLALALARQQEQVLLIDAQFRTADHHRLQELVTSRQAPGLAEFLADPTLMPQHVIQPTTLLAEVKCVPRGAAAINPDMLASRRLQDLLDAAATMFGVIILDGPAALEHVDAQLLAQRADGIVLVVRSRKSHPNEVESVVEALEPSGVPVLGAILNAVDAAYL